MVDNVNNMYDLKKGDFIASKREVWKITDVNGGNYLLLLVAVKDSSFKVGVKTLRSRSHIKHKLMNKDFFVVKKGKFSTIEVLFS